MDFPPKRVNERIIIGVDFAQILSDRPGVTIRSAAWRNVVAISADQNPEAMLQGQPNSVQGSICSTYITGGIADVGYYPLCDATLSDDEVVTLPDIGTGLLIVRP